MEEILAKTSLHKLKREVCEKWATAVVEEQASARAKLGAVHILSTHHRGAKGRLYFWESQLLDGTGLLII